MEFPTGIGTSDATSIRLLGHDLASEMIGNVGFGELALWLATQQRPTQQQVRVFEAVLVSLADHGFTPTAIAARLTLYSAPDALQGAMAAGLLGGGSRFLGVTEDTGKFLAGVLATVKGPLPETNEQWDELALRAVTEQRAAGKFVPGLGHPVHKQVDPRTELSSNWLISKGCEGRTCGCLRPLVVFIQWYLAVLCHSMARELQVQRLPILGYLLNCCEV